MQRIFINGVELGWPASGQPKPFYILSPYNHNDQDSLGVVLGASPTLRTRLAGVNPAAAENQDNYDRYFTAYRGAYRLDEPGFWPTPVLDPTCRIEHATFAPGESLSTGNWTIRTCLLPHPGGCIGYRVELPEGPVVAVATDCELDSDSPSEDERRSLDAFFEGVDLLGNPHGTKSAGHAGPDLAGIDNGNDSGC